MSKEPRSTETGFAHLSSPVVDPAAIGFLGILIGALIGWFAGLAVARRAHAYALELGARIETLTR